MHCCRCFRGWLSSLPWRSEWLAGVWGLGETLHSPPISHHLKMEKVMFTSEKPQDKSQTQWKSSCHVVEFQLLWWQLSKCIRATVSWSAVSVYLLSAFRLLQLHHWGKWSWRIYPSSPGLNPAHRQYWSRDPRHIQRNISMSLDLQ